MTKVLPQPKPSWAVRLLNPYVAIPLALFFLLLFSPFAYRGYKLSLVPDPGEPFDVAAFIKASEVDDADNALSDFETAISLLTTAVPWSEYELFHDEIVAGSELSPAAQSFVKYLKLNKSALLAWRKGTTKPSFCEVPLEELNYSSLLTISQEARNFARLLNAQAILECRDGNYEEAANCYLDCFRTVALLQDNGIMIQRLISAAVYSFTSSNLIEQIQDQQFPQNVLEQLIQELNAIHSTFTPVSISLKTEYLAFQDFVSSDYSEVSSGLIMGIPAAVPPSFVASYLYATGEPELSGRLYRQWQSNLLLEVDRPRHQRILFTTGSAPILLYHPSSKSLGNKRELSPTEIDEVWEHALLFKLFSPAMSVFMDGEDKFQMLQSLLVSALRLEIYRRQHGNYPAKLEEAFPDGIVPTDIFDPAGAPLRYAKDADHVCKIWSIGLNGKDDGGTSIGFKSDDTDYGYQLGKKATPTTP